MVTMKVGSVLGLSHLVDPASGAKIVSERFSGQTDSANRQRRVRVGPSSFWSTASTPVSSMASPC